MAEQEHRATLRDYVLLLRRRWFVILGIALIGAAVAFALTLTESKKYTATATLEAQTLQQSGQLAGIPTTNQQLPQQTSAELAQTATRDQILRLVKKRLGLDEDLEQLRSDISISQDQTSSLVVIEGSASSAQGAAVFTNAVANTVAATANRQVRERFAELARVMADEALKATAESATEESAVPASPLYIGPAAERARIMAELSARYAGLSKVADIVQVSAPATPPTSASSPKPLFNILIGAILGLLVGLLATWFLESLDRRLRRPDEAEGLLGLPLVAAIPKGVLGSVPGVRKAGKAGKVGKAGKGRVTPDPAELEAFRMLRTNARFLSKGEPPRSVLVTSPLPEEGKTTVAIGLAMAAAAAGQQVLLIEADVRRPAHADRLGLKREPGLSDYLHGGVHPQEVLQTFGFRDPGMPQSNGNTAAEGYVTVTCLTSGKGGAESAEVVGSEAFAGVLDQVKGAYDLVIVDSAPLLAVPETSTIVPLVDAVLLVVRLGRTTTEQARAGRDALARLPHELAGMVLTDLVPDAGGYYGYGSYGYGYTDDALTEAQPNPKTPV